MIGRKKFSPILATFLFHISRFKFFSRKNTANYFKLCGKLVGKVQKLDWKQLSCAAPTGVVPSSKPHQSTNRPVIPTSRPNQTPTRPNTRPPTRPSTKPTTRRTTRPTTRATPTPTTRTRVVKMYHLKISKMKISIFR